MTARDVSAILATWVGVLAAIIGGYLAYLEYAKSVERDLDERVVTAIGFVKDFQSEHFLLLREKMHDHIFFGDDGLSPSETFAFVEFFDAIKYCSDESLCDADVIGDVFGPYATWHWPCLEPTIEGTRSTEVFATDRPYGHGLETLALEDVGNRHCKNLRSPLAIP